MEIIRNKTGKEYHLSYFIWDLNLSMHSVAHLLDMSINWHNTTEGSWTERYLNIEDTIKWSHRNMIKAFEMCWEKP